MVRSYDERIAILSAIIAAWERPHEVLDAVLGAANVDAARASIAALLGVDATAATAVLDVQFRRGAAEERSRLVEMRDEARIGRTRLLDDMRAD